MAPVKRIGLITCGSNFERHGNTIRTMRKLLPSLGDYALYVFTNYGVYLDGANISHGEAAIYSLLEHAKLDGCILDSNLGSTELVEKVAGMIRSRGIPALAVDLQVPGFPYLHLETKMAGAEMLNHLIRVHGCKKINLVINQGSTVISASTLETYRRVLAEHHLPVDEKRIITIPVSTRNGRRVYDLFDKRGVMKDAQAVLCVHDAIAIGLSLELQDRGIRVPEDIRLCTMNCSANSIAFSPSLTGIDCMESRAAGLALELMDRLLRGQEVSPENTYNGEVRYLASCGCDAQANRRMEDRYVFQRIILNKLEAGNQVGRMMQYNDSLEQVDSLAQLSENILKMMEGVDCSSFYCCLNVSDPDYIESKQPDPRPASVSPYDRTMRVIAGRSARGEVMRDQEFSIREVAPVEPRRGDVFIMLPIHHINRDYGYMVFLNEMLPVDVYNYRICQESVGSSIESLHQQMILRRSNEEMNRIHMQDQMTGLYNRFAIRAYGEGYVSASEGYSVAILDMDDLKGINDTFGHLAGNNAICIVAGALRETYGPDLLIRYGGDEFLIISRDTKEEIWDGQRVDLEKRLKEAVQKQQLPYGVEVSMGYCISRPENLMTLDECIGAADRLMYADKKERKSRKQESARL